ncbi:hypothetical protein K2224_18685 [Streptomyces sp. BHT-5-2]|uniref:hypothetical protein n=1 Tax=unclassified Streptomyces TaxID=2593676 RepID=UPI001C8E0B2D|nr:hypothetical protein [Streptomyces sp. BHT-5-2]QZL04920.1 hypothetical protein K2224_18685 [Streptomyces sp. BHT-5-2]
MNRRTRRRIALASTFPTLLTVPLCALLVALGLMPWTILLAVPIALAVQVAITLTRLRSASSNGR